ncbi:hypothetical protein C8F04DRAFT_1188887 [Mycena alexandri]|uniref:Uncharacterized protein n=1 Tax=Mycena alexandri TaxID=1745969 RepID=A0AAD6WXF6_9AGAR|nr:hypothetical protein C8F04DRAFT_1188887 [Mycena alexandri]
MVNHLNKPTPGAIGERMPLLQPFRCWVPKNKNTPDIAPSDSLEVCGSNGPTPSPISARMPPLEQFRCWVPENESAQIPIILCPVVALSAVGHPICWDFPLPTRMLGHPTQSGMSCYFTPILGVLSQGNNSPKMVYFRVARSDGDPFISSSPGTRCGSLTSPISPPPRGTSSPRATTSRTPAPPSRTGRSGPKPIPAPVFTAPQQQPAIRPQHRVARRDPNSSRMRMASITAAMEEKDREEKHRRSLASSARRAVIAEALASTPKGQRGAEVGSSSKGKGKEVEEEEGEETDYDLDGEFLEIAKDWVPSEEHFDPTTENRPRDDA